MSATVRMLSRGRPNGSTAVGPVRRTQLQRSSLLPERGRTRSQSTVLHLLRPDEPHPNAALSPTGAGQPQSTHRHAMKAFLDSLHLASRQALVPRHCPVATAVAVPQPPNLYAPRPQLISSPVSSLFPHPPSLPEHLSDKPTANRPRQKLQRASHPRQPQHRTQTVPVGPNHRGIPCSLQHVNNNTATARGSKHAVRNIPQKPRPPLMRITHSSLPNKGRIVDPTQKQPARHPLIDNFCRAVSSKDTIAAMDLFQRIRHDNSNNNSNNSNNNNNNNNNIPTFDVPWLERYFNLVVPKQPMQALDAIICYHEHPDTTNVPPALYLKLFRTIEKMPLPNTTERHVAKFRDRLRLHLRDVHPQIKRGIYPRLLLAIMSQRTAILAEQASGIYNTILRDNIYLKPPHLLHLLSLCKFSRNQDLPYHDILQRFVETGHMSYPPITMAAIANLYPFQNSNKTITILQAALDLKSRRYIRSGTSEHERHYHVDYDISLDILENMSFTAARTKDTELIKLIWKAVDEFGHQPNEAIFENTITTFAGGGAYDLEMAFEALAVMQQEGFSVTRATVRGFSYSLRTSWSHISAAISILQRPTKSEWVSIHSINAVISACAERGDHETAMTAYRLIARNRLNPNMDTCIFIMECFGKSVARQNNDKRGLSHELSMKYVEALLELMDAAEMEPSTEFVRQYVEFLCGVGEVDTATEVVRQQVAGKSTMIDNRTVYRAALANALVGNDEVADELASHMTEHGPFLRQKIRSKRQRKQHLESIATNMEAMPAANSYWFSAED